MRFYSVALAAAIGSFVAGCSGDSSGTATGGSGAGGANKKLRIAVIPKGTTHDFWKSVHAGALDAAAEFGNVEIIWNGTDTETDKEGQIKIADTFIGEKVDGIVLAPIDRDALISPVRRAGQRKIPVVIFDSALSDLSGAVSYVATDNLHGGEMAADYLARMMGGKGGVLLLRYQAGSESTEQREDGFLARIKNYPDIKVLSENQRADSDTTNALKIGESLLRNHKADVTGVFTVCEPVNKGMLQALENEQRAGKVHFVAFDSDPRILKGLKEHSVDGIVLQNPVRMGYLAVKAMVDHIQGRPVEARIPTGEKLATPENMDEPALRELLEPKQAG